MDDDMKNGFFSAYLCHICKSKESFNQSKLCSACKLVSYCSKEHQKADWKNHKSICKAVQEICRNKRVDDIYDVGHYLLSLHKIMSRMTLQTNLPDVVSKSDWVDLKTSVVKLIENHLKRGLNLCEMNMVYVPKHCVVCFTRKNIKKELVCTNCYGAAYCSVEHQALDNHEKLCSDFQKVLDVDLYMLNVNFNSPVIHLIKPDEAVDLKLNALNMKSFIENHVKQGLKFEEEALISFYFTGVLTFAHTIKRIPNFTLGKRLIIHIVGAKMDCEARVVDYWENLLHLFPDVCAVTIVHISPCIFGPPIKLKLCADCKTANRCVNIFFIQQLYHEYYCYPVFVKKPDVIVAFNSGLYDTTPGYDFWAQSLHLFFQHNNVPFILTEASKHEAEDDLKRLFSRARDKKVKVVVECEKNPFKSLKPWKCLDAEDTEVWYKNSFVSALIVESG